MEQERDVLTKKYRESVEVQGQLQEQNFNIEGHTTMLKDQAAANIEAIKTIYSDIRKMIEDKENQVLDNIQGLLKKEEEGLL